MLLIFDDFDYVLGNSNVQYLDHIFLSIIQSKVPFIVITQQQVQDVDIPFIANVKAASYDQALQRFKLAKFRLEPLSFQESMNLLEARIDLQSIDLFKI